MVVCRLLTQQVSQQQMQFNFIIKKVLKKTKTNPQTPTKQLRYICSQAWWYTPTIPAPRRQSPENSKSQDTLVYTIVSSWLSRTTEETNSLKFWNWLLKSETGGFQRSSVRILTLKLRPLFHFQKDGVSLALGHELSAVKTEFYVLNSQSLSLKTCFFSSGFSTSQRHR